MTSTPEMKRGANAHVANMARPPQTDGNARKRKGPYRMFFLKIALAEYLLITVLSLALIPAVCYGFYLDAGLRNALGIQFALIAPLLAIMLAGGRRKRALVPAVIGAIAYAALVFAVAAAISPAGSAFFVNGSVNDVESNYVLFAVICLVVALLAFLLSRRSWTAIALIGLTVVVYAFIQYMFRTWIVDEGGLALATIGTGAAFALAVFARYKESVMSVKRARRPAFGPALAFSAVVSALSLGLAALVFALVINPMALETPRIKIFQDNYYPPTIEYTGTYSPEIVNDPDLLSSSTNDNVLPTGQNAEGGSNIEQREGAEGEGDAANAAIEQLLSAFDASNWAEQFQTISYSLPLPLGVFLAFVVIIALAAAIASRRLVRTSHLKKARALPPGDHVLYLAGFIESRLAMLGNERTPDQTPIEFALQSREALAPFSRGLRDVDFLSITLLCQRIQFGGYEPTDKETALVEAYYQALFKHAKNQVGTLRWCVKWYWKI